MMYRQSRWLLCLCMNAALMAGSAQAQSSRLSPKEIGQIIDAALQAVVPPELPLTSHTVAERGIRFDFGRTMTAFGYADDASVRASLRLTRAVTEGSDSLLTDCDQMGSKSCSLLGRSAYVSLQPISVSNAGAVVRVDVIWATPSSTRTYESGSSTEVILSRFRSGSWTFVRLGRRIIS